MMAVSFAYLVGLDYRLVSNMWDTLDMQAGLNGDSHMLDILNFWKFKTQLVCSSIELEIVNVEQNEQTWLLLH